MKAGCRAASAAAVGAMAGGPTQARASDALAAKCIWVVQPRLLLQNLGKRLGEKGGGAGIGLVTQMRTSSSWGEAPCWHVCRSPLIKG